MEFEKLPQNYPLEGYIKYPLIGVGAVVWRNNDILLVKRAKPPRLGQWSIPGGKQELGETIEEAVHREILEETSVKIKIVGLIDVVDAINLGKKGAVEFHATLIDYAAQYIDGKEIAGSDAKEVGWFGVDEIGLDKVDRAILDAITVLHEGGPVGLSTLSISVGEQPETVEDVYEPFLIQQGLLQRTPRGRVATRAAFAHLGLPIPERGSAGPSLFD